MSSLFDQLSSSGGAERQPGTTSTSSSYYHSTPRTANQQNTRWNDRVQQSKQEWGRRVKHHSSGGTSTRRTTSPQQRRAEPTTALEIRSYRPTDTSRPYAYEPVNGQLEWARPTWQDVLRDLMWKIAESAIAAAGMAIAEFFLHRRFHPGPGVKW